MGDESKVLPAGGGIDSLLLSVAENTMVVSGFQCRKETRRLPFFAIGNCKVGFGTTGLEWGGGSERKGGVHNNGVRERVWKIPKNKRWRKLITREECWVKIQPNLVNGFKGARKYVYRQKKKKKNAERRKAPVRGREEVENNFCETTPGVYNC